MERCESFADQLTKALSFSDRSSFQMGESLPRRSLSFNASDRPSFSGFEQLEYDQEQGTSQPEQGGVGSPGSYPEKKDKQKKKKKRNSALETFRKAVKKVEQILKIKRSKK